ncbi:hypothetical protein HK097_007705 [Rhizophlyctis rosea]|uniref:C2 NT-type domain-containing protein n=1 Tax=Rhizophlyctis rosea TaxID=64517 RepID=A0AAD5X4J0_9FUNG|nr:hypothetical protein HK097_007705 [Rhizophlyctis rosea]
MDLLFVPKSRKVRFHVQCILHDLTNLPYVSGLYFARWKLRSGGSAAGATQRATVKDHIVNWDSAFTLEANMVIGKDGVLLPCELLLHIKQVVNGGRSTEDVGMVTVNLAEFAGDRSTTRRYLLQEAGVNSIVKLTIDMQLTKGEPSYKVPEPSKRDISLEGIRGILADEREEEKPTHDVSRAVANSPHDRLTRVHSIFGPAADDPNVDFVDQIFAHAKEKSQSS